MDGIKKYKIGDNILKVHYLVKRLTLRLIKSDKHFHSYDLNSLTVVLYIFFNNAILSNELSVQKLLKGLMVLDCLSQNVSILRLHDKQKSAKIRIF